jgi:hypothetical protein
MTEAEKPSQRWIPWLIAGIWLLTAVSVLLASRTHPATTANLTVNTRAVSFRTTAGHILGQSDEEQLLISGVTTVRIQFATPRTLQVGGSPRRLTSLKAAGDSFATCSLYQVRSSGFEVLSPSLITLEVLDATNANNRSFSMKSHGALNDNLTSLPGSRGLVPGLECRGVRVNEGPPQSLDGTLSPDGGDSIFISTSSNTRLDFTLAGNSEVSDTQIPVLGELRFSEIDPRTSEEKSVLLTPGPEIVFEKMDKKVTVNPGDLLVVDPKDHFYLRQFTIKNGIQVSLHGVVRNVRAGAGANDLATLLPSTFDRLDNLKRIYGAIPALVALLLGFLDKMGALTKK